MAQLPNETITIVLELQRRLLDNIHQAKAIELTIFERFGETEQTEMVLEQLQNITDRLRNPYSRFCTLLLRIAEEQPIASRAMLELLERSLEQAEATIEAAEATLQETRRDFNLL